MFKLILRLSWLFFFLSLTACVKQSVVVSSETMQGQGLLVAHISASRNGMGKFFKNGNATISKEEYRGALKDGFIAIPMPPGKYEFELLTRNGYNRIQSLPLKAKFTINVGEVTNLGEVFMDFKTLGENRYRTFFIDNNDDMQRYLRQQHASVYKTLKNKKIKPAEVKYLSDKHVELLKRVAISQTAMINRYYLKGPLGGLAKVVRDKKNKVVDLKWLPTNTLLAIDNCAESAVALSCIVPDSKKGEQVFYSSRTKHTLIKKPKHFTDGEFYNLADGSLLWMNKDFSFYRSKDFLKTWQFNKTYKAAVESSSFDFSSYAKTPQVSYGQKGFYVYSRLDNAPFFYTEYMTGKSKKMQSPVNKDGLFNVVETANKLYVTPESRAVFSGSKIYVLAKSKDVWLEQEVEPGNCGELTLVNYKKDIVEVACGGNKHYQSTKTNEWKEVVK